VAGGELPAAVRAAAEATRLPLLATIPLDPCVSAFDAAGLPIQSIPLDSLARLAIDAVMQEILGTQKENV
jgi:CO dehydrogenase nickel-insertion accessory protein CooC1